MTAAEAAVPAALREAMSAPLVPHRIAAAAALAADAVETVLQTGSTNADLLALARARAPRAPRLRAALVQSAGRGRMGRRWHAEAGAALLFSLALPLAGAAPPAATLVAGVALAETLAAELDLETKLKWPNDVLLDGRKLAGVLAELATDRDGRRTLVVGVGVNLWLDAAARASIGQPAAAAAERVPLARLLARREALIGAIAAALLAALREAEQHGFVPFQARFMQRFALVGRSVDLIEQGAAAGGGRVLGVDGAGRLLLERGGRVVVVASGEVSLRARAAVPRSAGAKAVG